MKKPTKKKRGGGGKASKPATADRMDSEPENFSPKDNQKPIEEPKRGRIFRDNRTLARIEAKTTDDLDAALEVINAGARIIHEAEAWNMKPEDYWQLQNFPSDPEDWEGRMQRLITSKLGDAKSDVDGLMHSCTWTIDLLWKWLHELATKAENPNHKRDAGRTLGRLYHQARQASEEERLSNANEEFRRGINPYPWGAKKPPAKELVHWVNRKIRRHFEHWKTAIEVASTFEQKKFFHRDDRDSRGVHYFVRLPMSNIKEAWDSYLIQERHAHPKRSRSWSDFLDGLGQSPFCLKALSLDQLINFKTCWKLALHDVFKAEWNQDSEIKKICGSFVKKFGDLKHETHMEGAGFHLAKDYFERFFLSHWTQMQRLQRMFEESMQRDLKDFDKDDPLTRILLARADAEKSSIG